MKIQELSLGILLASLLTGLTGNSILCNEVSSKPSPLVFGSDSTGREQVLIANAPAERSHPWTVKLPDAEVKASNNVQPHQLIYGIKDGNQVIVYQRNIQSGQQIKLLEFQESVQAKKSANLWDGLPPNIALSPNQQWLAYVDRQGLKIYDLKTGYRKTLISKNEIPNNIESVPSWSIQFPTDTYDLSTPQWSTTNNYISFLEVNYEGASCGIIDLKGNYFNLDLGAGYQNLVWSPIENAIIKAGFSDFESTGLYVSSPIESKIVTNIAKTFGKEHAFFDEANYSYDGKKIVFIMSDEEEYNKERIQRLAIAQIDGSGFSVLEEGQNLATPIFSPKGEAIFYIKTKTNNQSVLYRYDLAEKSRSEVALLPVDFTHWTNPLWTEDGYLSLVGVHRSSSLVLGGDRTRLLILDLNNREIVYASQVFRQFTTFAGMVH